MRSRDHRRALPGDFHELTDLEQASYDFMRRAASLPQKTDRMARSVDRLCKYAEIAAEKYDDFLEQAIVHEAGTLLRSIGEFSPSARALIKEKLESITHE